jgi:hypothetical protein
VLRTSLSRIDLSHWDWNGVSGIWYNLDKTGYDDRHDSDELLGFYRLFYPFAHSSFQFRSKRIVVLDFYVC